MSEVEFFIIAGISITLIFIAFIVSFLFISHKRHDMYLQEKQLLQSQYNNAIIQSQLEIQEKTFNDISIELHDNVLQMLGLVKFDLLVQAAKNEAVTPRILNEASLQVGTVIQSIRSLSHGLNTQFIKDQGLEKAVEKEAERLEKTGKYRCFFNCTADCYYINESRSIVIFRIVQELVHNIIKHSKATEVHFTIIENNTHYIFEVIDNGSGFNLSQVLENKTGIGLSNIIDRSKLINSTLVLNSAPLAGTKATLTVDKVVV